MSSTFTFYKKITLKDIKEKTDIEIEYSDSKFPIWLKYNNTFLSIQYFGKHTKFKNINIEPIELTRHGMTNPGYIIDTIVKTFKTAFVVDDFYDNLWYGLYNTIEERNQIFIDCMNHYNYSFNDYNLDA